MKRLLTLALFSLLATTTYSLTISRDSITESKKIRKHKTIYKFGGMVDARVMYNSYKSHALRDEVVYFYPLAPSYDPAGVDINREGELKFSLFSSRLNFGVSNFKVFNADANAYIEGDFLGSTDNYLQLFRLRHAYINFTWRTNKLLIGQTNNLNFTDEVNASTVDLAGGLPYNTLNRGAQVKYEHLFSKYIKLRFAAEIYQQHKSVGPSDAQYKAMIPAMNLQMVFGENKVGSVLGGFTVGAQFLKPRSVDNLGYKIDKIVPSYSVNAFLKFYASGYKFQLWGIYGGNLTPLTMLGGYGKVADQSVDGNYDFANVRTLSTWFDFETPIFRKFQAGFFVGYQRNMGSSKALDLTRGENGDYLYGYYRDCNLQWFGRLSPRLYYHALEKLSFGIEYSCNVASWASKVDNHFKAVDKYNNTINNRVVLAARYTF